MRDSSELGAHPLTRAGRVLRQWRHDDDSGASAGDGRGADGDGDAVTALWPLARSPRRRTRPEDPADPGYAASVLRANPVLLLPGPTGDGAVNRLLGDWNPEWERAGKGRSEFGGGERAGVCASVSAVADGVRWAGPFRLDTVSSAEAGLPSGWSTAYAAIAARSRARVPDGLDAALVRLRYPDGMPTGAEAVAWSLIMGLARRLDGAGRLPAASSRRAQSVTAQRALAQEDSYCVYGNEVLPWTSLRSVLCLSLPELDRNGSLADDDYCLDRPGAFEVRVRPFRAGEFMPYALRPHAADSWPGAVYRFRCLPQQSESAARRVGVQLRAAACQLAEVVGGIVLDGDGFPLRQEVGMGVGTKMMSTGMGR